ncbi:MAG: ABC1 kinase family protein, partial [archaeon]
SLGQVYRAKINGEEVAVKVNRPNIGKLIEADLSIVRNFMPFVKKLIGPARSYSTENIINEFGRVLKQEMNYKREAKYMEKIRENFEGNKKIKIPQVKWSHTTQKVLTMDYIPGTKIKESEEIKEMNVSPRKIADNIINAYLQMVIKDGAFQADPHPGNIAVTEKGEIVIYDFGMSGEITYEVKQKITRLYLALARKDTRGIIRSLIALGTLKPGVRIDVLEKIAQKEMKQLTEEREEWRAEEILQSAQQVMYKYPFRIPEHLAMLIRMAVIIEGECRKLDPKFNFIKSTKKYIKRKGIEREQVERKLKESMMDLEKNLYVATKTPQKIDNIADQLKRGEIDINAQIEDPDKIMQSIGTQIILGMLTSASLLFTALTIDKSPIIPVMGTTLTLTFLFGLILSFRERQKAAWEPRKPIE